MWRAALPLLASQGIAVLAAADAHAQPITMEPILELDWRAPPECPDGTHVKARVEELVGRSHAARALPARGRVSTSSEGPRYRLDLVVGTAPPDERTMADPDCARLAEAAALILALDIDAAAHEHEAPARTTPEPPELAPAERTPERRPRPRPPPPPPPSRPATPERISLDLGARAVFDDGSLPKTTAGVAVVAGIASGSFALDIRGAAYKGRFTGGPRDGAGGAYVDLVAAGLDACMQRRIETTGVRACAGGELGRMETRGVGIAQPGSSAALWGAALISVEARPFQHGVVSPVVGLAVGHPFSAPNVVIRGFGTVFEPPVLFFRTYLGLQVHFF